MPIKGEKKHDYLQRYMSSSEAIHDFPDEKQRFAVALSEWEKTHKSEEDIYKSVSKSLNINVQLFK